MTSHLMHFLSLLIICCHSDEFWKSICICKKESCSVVSTYCQNKPIIDPTVSTFIEDLNYARKNIKNIELYYNSNNDIELTFDMRSISGLTINFTNYYGKVSLTLKYVNNDDYEGNYLNFNDKWFPTFVPIEDSKSTNTLRVGSIEVQNNLAAFYQNRGKNTILKFQNLNISTASLVNISSFDKSLAGSTHLKIGYHDVLDIRFSKLNPVLKINETTIPFTYIKGDTYTITGEYILRTSNTDTLKLSFDSNMRYEDIPPIDFNRITFVEFIGKLWKPTAESYIKSMTRVGTVTIPPGDFPFSIFSDMFNLKVSGDVTIYGDIDASQYALSSAIMNVTTDLTTRTKVTFKGYVDSDILIHSPYLDLIIDNFTHNISTVLVAFPIGFCFNEKAGSHVTVKSLSFRGFNKTKASEFVGYVTLSRVFTDLELDGNEILQGFEFLDLPADTLSSNSFTVVIDIKSPTSENGFPGFTSANNCMNCTLVKSDRFKLKAFKGRTAFDSPAFICLTPSSSCDNPPGIKGYPYNNVKDLADGDISQFVHKGYDEIYIATEYTDQEIPLNFDNLPQSNYTVTIMGYAWSKFKTSIWSLKDTYSKIGSLKIRKSQINQGFQFNMPEVKFEQVVFNSSNEFTFGKNSIVYADAGSLDSLNKFSTKIQMNEVYFNHFYEKYKDNRYFKNTDFDETFKVDNNLLTLCTKGLRDEQCANNIDLRYFNKFTVESNSRIKFDISSINSDFRTPSIIVKPRRLNSQYAITFTGGGWDTKLNKKILLDHDNYPIVYKISTPGQIDNFELKGKGFVLYQVIYVDNAQYCFYNVSATNTCYSPRPFNTKQNKSDSFLSELNVMNGYSYKLELDNSEKPYKIPFSFFNNKKLYLKSSGRVKVVPSEVEITNFKDLELNPIYSLTILNTIKLIYDEDTQTTINFGQLKLEKDFAVSEKWKENVILNVSQFVCTYDDLYKFKKIVINDQLNISGKIPEDARELAIDFVPDDDPNDLVMELNGDSKITVGNGFIKVGLYTFHIKHSRNYDAYFQLKSEATVTIESLVDNEEEFTKFVLDCERNKVNIIFIGKYPDVSPDKESLIKITGKEMANLTMSSSIPLSIFNFYDIEFNLMSPTIKTIQGPIEYFYQSPHPYKNTKSRVRFINHQEEKISLYVPQGYNIGRIESSGYRKETVNFTGLLSSNIELRIGKITSTADDTGYLAFFNTIGSTGSSKISIDGYLPTDFKISQKFFIYPKVTGLIQDEDNFPFVKTDETIIEARSQDFLNNDFQFIYLADSVKGLTHGFYPGANCLAIKQDILEGVSSGIQLFAQIKPSEIPFIIDFTSKDISTDGELIINEDNIDVLNDISSLLPNKFVGVVLRLYKDMIPQKPLNLNAILQKHDSVIVTIISMAATPFEAYVTLPSTKALKTVFTNVKLGFDFVGKQGNFIASSANFTDCEFLNGNEIKISNELKEIVLDVDSLNALVKAKSLESYEGKLNINSANVVLFTKDGWEFREDRSKKTVLIKSSDFKEIECETRRFCLLMIDDENLKAIKSFKFNAYPDDDQMVYFELSRKWGNIKDLNGFKINVNGAETVNLNTASYPIPNLFDISESSISYTLETDVEGEFDTITLPNDRIFYNENLYFDFMFLPDEYQQINSDNVIFDGNSSITFRRQVGVFRANTSLFKEDSFSDFSRLEILKKMEIEKGASLYGTFKFGLTSEIQFHWTLSSFPMIVHKKSTKTSPMAINIIYDGTDIDKIAYRKKLMNGVGMIMMKGDFDCFNMKQNISFSSQFEPLGKGNTNIVAVCDSSSEGQVLLLQGVREIIDDEDDNSDAGSGGGSKISGGGVAGVVIACAIVVAVIAAVAVYIVQRIKIDKLKNEIPASKTGIYNTSATETYDNSYVTRDDSEEF